MFLELVHGLTFVFNNELYLRLLQPTSVILIAMCNVVYIDIKTYFKAG